MAPEEESKPETSPSEPAGPTTANRGRRSGRGRRGRGRGRGGRARQQSPEPRDVVETDAATSAEETESIFELAETPEDMAAERAEELEAEPQAEPEPSREPEPEPLAEPLPPRGQPASPASVEKAIEEVSTIVEALRMSLDQMEEVLEMLEVFERQKNADEREIESLRRAVRQVHRPRDSGHHHHR